MRPDKAIIVTNGVTAISVKTHIAAARLLIGITPPIERSLSTIQTEASIDGPGSCSETEKPRAGFLEHNGFTEIFNNGSFRDALSFSRIRGAGKRKACSSDQKASQKCTQMEFQHWYFVLVNSPK
ncbi:MAG: hypothetical protein GXP30_06715 [Verrucomicrobia bacterium]|nr:hypothetical protein [Verrucomicrobiota bacterium]